MAGMVHNIMFSDYIEFMLFCLHVRSRMDHGFIVLYVSQTEDLPGYHDY